MPRVPQFNRTVSPEVAKNEYINSYATPEAFGLNVTKAKAQLGDAATSFIADMEKIKDRIDDTKILGLSNYSQEWEQKNLYDKDNGYYYKMGQDAYGQSEVLLKNYNDYMNDYIKKSNLSPYARKRAEYVLSHMRSRIESGITKHDYKQGIVWADNEAETNKNNYLNSAINQRNNPEEMKKCLGSALQAIEFQGEIKHLDRSAVELEKKKFISSAHEAILGAYLSEGSLKASEYFEQHKAEINPDKLPRYIDAVKNNELLYTARNTANYLVNVSPEEAYNYIDNIKDTNTRNAVESEYNRILRHQDEIQKQTDMKISNDIMQRVFYAFDNGEDVSAIMREVNSSNMSLEQKEKLYKNIKSMQELKGVGDNWADYNILLDMAAFDNENFKTINPANYNLTKEQYNSIVEMQRKAANNEYTPEAELKKAINGMFDSWFNPQLPNGLHTSEYNEEVVRFLSAVERMQGKAFDLNNKAQLESIMKGFDYKDESATNKNIDEVKELFTRAKKHGEAYKFMAREYMQFKGVNKREPYPEEIYDMAKRTYNTIENEWKIRNNGKLNTAQGLYQNISSTANKKGETKVLTYYADTRIPQISRELGIPLQVTSRYRAGDSGGHGKGRKCDVGMAALNVSQRLSVFEKMLSEPGVASIGTSDPILLKRFNNPPNPKIRDLREYDANYKKSHPNTTMNHVNHIDISFDTRYGGDKQG